MALWVNIIGTIVCVLAVLVGCWFGAIRTQPGDLSLREIFKDWRDRRKGS